MLRHLQLTCLFFGVLAKTAVLLPNRVANVAASQTQLRETAATSGSLPLSMLNSIPNDSDSGSSSADNTAFSQLNSFSAEDAAPSPISIPADSATNLPAATTLPADLISQIAANDTSLLSQSPSNQTSHGRVLLQPVPQDPDDRKVFCWDRDTHNRIRNPQDCYVAESRLYHEDDPVEQVRWKSDRTWAFGSCMILVWPEKAGEEDVFSALDIVYWSSHIRETCLRGFLSYRGGYAEIGRKGTWHVSVEAVPSEVECGQWKCIGGYTHDNVEDVGSS